MNEKQHNGGKNHEKSYVDTCGNQQKFYDKTAQLRQDLTAKQGEYNALLATTNPDPKRTAELSREIAAQHNQLRAQAAPITCLPRTPGITAPTG